MVIILTKKTLPHSIEMLNFSRYSAIHYRQRSLILFQIIQRGAQWIGPNMHFVIGNIVKIVFRWLFWEITTHAANVRLSIFNSDFYDHEVQRPTLSASNLKALMLLRHHFQLEKGIRDHFFHQTTIGLIPWAPSRVIIVLWHKILKICSQCMSVILVSCSFMNHFIFH